MEVPLPRPMRAQNFQGWLKSLPVEVLRVKGVVQFTEELDKWIQFNHVDAQNDAAVFQLP